MGINGYGWVWMGMDGYGCESSAWMTWMGGCRWVFVCVYSCVDRCVCVCGYQDLCECMRMDVCVCV